MRKRILGVVFLFFLSSKSQAITGSDMVLTTPYLVKSGLSVGILKLLKWPQFEELGSGSNFMGLAISVGILAPNLYTLGSLAFADQRDIRTARKYAYASEMVTAGAVFISGIILLAPGDRGSEFGIVPMGLGLLLALAAQLNLIPFDAEKTTPIQSATAPILSVSIPF